MPLILLLIACGVTNDDSSASATEVVTYPPVEGDPCDAVTLQVNGADPPVVGDVWTVWLYCDDALLTGAMILQFDPPELASVQDNSAVFLTEGKGVVRMQVGSRRAEQSVTVGAAR